MRTARVVRAFTLLVAALLAGGGLAAPAIGASGAAAHSTAARATPDSSAATLLFDDEFSASSLDATSWAPVTPWNSSFTVGELEFYLPENVTLSDGDLHLVTSASSDGYVYASGIVTSLPRPKFSYGYFEVRAKLPTGKGLWPAFWLTNDDTLEIDGFEMLGDRPSRIYQSLHQNNQLEFQRHFDGPDFSAGYHTFGIDWKPTGVDWYVDGVLRNTVAQKMPADPLWICLNTAVGGSWPGPPDATTVFPQSFDIDYVRVWDHRPSIVKAVHPIAAEKTTPAAAGAAPSATLEPAPSAKPVAKQSGSRDVSPKKVGTVARKTRAPSRADASRPSEATEGGKSDVAASAAEWREAAEAEPSVEPMQTVLARAAG